jgi:uncharacterized protein YacL (UPF0231 family)
MDEDPDQLVGEFDIDLDESNDTIISNSSSSSSSEISDYFLGKKLPLTRNDKELYPDVVSLIDLGRYNKSHESNINRNTKLLNFINVDNIRIDPEAVYPENIDHLEKYFSIYDIESINLPDNDFVTYMYNGKELVKVNENDSNNNDEDHSDLSYEEKVMFLASKLCKSKMDFWSRKLQDTNNKLRSYISYQSTYTKSSRAAWYNILNTKANYFPSTNDPYKMNQPLKYVYKGIRNSFNDEWEREEFEKRNKDRIFEFQKIKYLRPITPVPLSGGRLSNI